MTKYPRDSFIIRGHERCQIQQECDHLRLISPESLPKRLGGFWLSVDLIEESGWKEEGKAKKKRI